MLNQIVLVGTLEEHYPFKEKGYGVLKIKIPREKVLLDGIEADFIEIIVTEKLMSQIELHLEKDMLIGVKGNIRNYGNRDYIFGNKITYASSKGVD